MNKEELGIANNKITEFSTEVSELVSHSATVFSGVEEFLKDVTKSPTAESMEEAKTLLKSTIQLLNRQQLDLKKEFQETIKPLELQAQTIILPSLFGNNASKKEITLLKDSISQVEKNLDQITKDTKGKKDKMVKMIQEAEVALLAEVAPLRENYKKSNSEIKEKSDILMKKWRPVNSKLEDAVYAYRAVTQQKDLESTLKTIAAEAELLKNQAQESYESFKADYKKISGKALAKVDRAREPLNQTTKLTELIKGSLRSLDKAVKDTHLREDEALEAAANMFQVAEGKVIAAEKKAAAKKAAAEKAAAEKAAAEKAAAEKAAAEKAAIKNIAKKYTTLSSIEEGMKKDPLSCYTEMIRFIKSDGDKGYLDTTKVLNEQETNAFVMDKSKPFLYRIKMMVDLSKSIKDLYSYCKTKSVDGVRDLLQPDSLNVNALAEHLKDSKAVMDISNLIRVDLLSSYFEQHKEINARRLAPSVEKYDPEAQKTAEECLNIMKKAGIEVAIEKFKLWFNENIKPIFNTYKGSQKEYTKTALLNNEKRPKNNLPARG